MSADLFCKFIAELQAEHGLSLSQIARRLDETVDQIEAYRTSGAPVFMHVTRATVLKELSEEGDLRV